MAENPAIKPAADPVEGDNLTAQQAALLLAVLEGDPNAALEAAEQLEMTEDDIDDLIGMLSEMAGDEDQAEEGEEEADSNGEEEVTE